jgi:hypothetical protein
MICRPHGQLWKTVKAIVKETLNVLHFASMFMTMMIMVQANVSQSDGLVSLSASNTLMNG